MRKLLGLAWLVLLCLPALGAEPKPAERAPSVAWVDEVTGRTLFTSSDLVRFDWERQAFELKPAKVVELMAEFGSAIPLAILKGKPERNRFHHRFALKDEKGILYRGTMVHPGATHFAELGAAPTIDLSGLVQHGDPVLHIEEDHEPDVEDVRFPVRLREDLEGAGLLGAIPPSYEPKRANFFGTGGGRGGGLNLTVECFLDDLQPGRKARLHLRMRYSPEYKPKWQDSQLVMTVLDPACKFVGAATVNGPSYSNETDRTVVLWIDPWKPTAASAVKAPKSEVVTVDIKVQLGRRTGHGFTAIQAQRFPLGTIDFVQKRNHPPVYSQKTGLLKGQAVFRALAFWKAVERNDLASATRLLAEHPELMDVTDDEGWFRPLHAAVESGSEDVAALLLDRGADVNEMNRIDETPLHAAAQSGHADLAALLIGRGAKVNLDPPQGEGESWISPPPLHLAACGDHLEVARLLLDHGAVIDSPDDYDRTPLRDAVEAGLTDMAALLLARGARLDKATLDGTTALHLAAVEGDVPMCRVLLAGGADLEALDANRTPLAAAAAAGKIEVVRLLIEKGAQVNSPDFGNAPLTQAISRNRYDVAVLLVENGANAKAENADHYTLLHVATSTDNPRLAELLLQHGADINARPPRTVVLGGPWGRPDLPGETPLGLALMHKHNKIAEYLRAQGGVE